MRPLQTYGRSLRLLIRFLSFTRATLCYSHGPVSLCVCVCLLVCQVGVLLKRLTESRKLSSTYTAHCPSVCLSVPAAAAAGGFAAEVGRGQLDIDRQLLLSRDTRTA